MPTRKIGEYRKATPCRNREHNPPTMYVFEPGVYEHECPECGLIQTFVVKPRVGLNNMIRFYNKITLKTIDRYAGN